MAAIGGDMVHDLGALAEVEVADAERIDSLRTLLEGGAGRVFQAVGVAIPPPVRTADVAPRAWSGLAGLCESRPPRFELSSFGLTTSEQPPA